MTFTVLILTLALFGALVSAYRYGMSPLVLAVLLGSGPVAMIATASRLDLQLFTWVKVFTLAATMVVLVARRRATGRRAEILSRVIVGILALNILEAMVADVADGAWWNALAGGLLVATQRGPSAVGTRRLGNRVAVTYDLPWGWLLAYTLWNFAVVCAHYPQHWIDHIAVLAAPLAAVLLARDRTLWLEARVCTLGVLGNAVVLVIEVARGPWIPSTPMPGLVPPVITFAALAVGVGQAVAWWRTRRGRATPGTA